MANTPKPIPDPPAPPPVVYVSRFYEDTIGAIFTTRELAQADCDARNKASTGSGWEVEGWEVNAAPVTPAVDDQSTRIATTADFREAVTPRPVLPPPPPAVCSHPSRAADGTCHTCGEPEAGFCKLFPDCQHTAGSSGYCACHQAKPAEVLNTPLDCATPPPVDRSAITTIHGTPVDELRVQQAAQPTGQHADYIVLTAEERAKGFVRPVRRSYVHLGAPAPKYPTRDLTPEEHERYGKYGYVKWMDYPAGSPESERSLAGRFFTQEDLDHVGKGCGAKTTMGQTLAETYARDPKFYGATFCCSCDRHFPVGADGEFVWDGTSERVGT